MSLQVGGSTTTVFDKAMHVLEVREAPSKDSTTGLLPRGMPAANTVQKLSLSAPTGDLPAKVRACRAICSASKKNGLVELGFECVVPGEVEPLRSTAPRKTTWKPKFLSPPPNTPSDQVPLAKAGLTHLSAAAAAGRWRDTP